MDIKIKKLKASYEELARTITNQFAPLLSEVLQDLNLIFSIGDGKTAKKQMPWDKTLLKDGIDLIKEFFAIPERFANQFDLTFDTSIKAPKGLKVFEDPKALDFLDKKIRRIGNGVVTITDEVNKFKDKFKSSSVTIGEVKKEIEKLKTEQDNLVFGSTSYKENVAEINKLIKSITPEIKKQADALIAATDRARAIITPVTAIEIKQTGEANKPKAISDSKESVDRFNESLKTTDELSSSISQGFEAAGNELAYTMSNAVRLFGQANSVLEQFLDTLIRVAIQAAVMKAFSFIFGAILAPFTGGASLTGAGVSGTAAPQISDIPTLNTLNNSFPTNTGYAGLGRKIELLNKSINKVNASVQAMNLNMINGKPVQVAIITSDPTARVKGDMAVRNRMLRGGVNEMELM